MYSKLDRNRNRIWRKYNRKNDMTKTVFSFIIVLLSMSFNFCFVIKCSKLIVSSLRNKNFPILGTGFFKQLSRHVWSKLTFSCRHESKQDRLLSVSRANTFVVAKFWSGMLEFNCNKSFLFWRSRKAIGSLVHQRKRWLWRLWFAKDSKVGIPKIKRHKKSTFNRKIELLRLNFVNLMRFF